jgi:hypothetical protein
MRRPGSDNVSYVTSAAVHLRALLHALGQDPAEATRRPRLAGGSLLLALFVLAGMAGR